MSRWRRRLPVAFVDPAECDPLGGRGGRTERNRTGDQSQLEAVVTRLQPMRLPAQAARQLPDQSTALRVGFLLH